MKIQNRRFFLHSLAIGSIGIPFGFDLLAKDKNDPDRFQIGVQEYTFNRMLRSGKLKHLDYPVLVKKELGIEHVEYWSRPLTVNIRIRNLLVNCSSERRGKELVMY